MKWKEFKDLVRKVRSINDELDEKNNGNSVMVGISVYDGEDNWIDVPPTLETTAEVSKAVNWQFIKDFNIKKHIEKLDKELKK
jgi:hypothetical protein